MAVVGSGTSVVAVVWFVVARLLVAVVGGDALVSFINFQHFKIKFLLSWQLFRLQFNNKSM